MFSCSSRKLCRTARLCMALCFLLVVTHPPAKMTRIINGINKNFTIPPYLSGTHYAGYQKGRGTSIKISEPLSKPVSSRGRAKVVPARTQVRKARRRPRRGSLRTFRAEDEAGANYSRPQQKEVLLEALNTYPRGQRHHGRPVATSPRPLHL